jgi:hypothetical protein
MAFDAATAALRYFVLGEPGEEACRRPAFLVGLLGEFLGTAGEQLITIHQVERRHRLLAQPVD